MIESLQIQNYALIETLEINFSKGLTIITGETGAGKSILLGALGLIMGNRADTKVLYHEDQKCFVEAVFDISKYDLKRFFKENDLDYEDELVIRREITPSGKTRAFVNDSPVNLKILQRLSSSLIDLHQQFDTLDIHNVSFQLRLLDALAGNKKVLEEYQKAFETYQRNRRQLNKLLSQTEQNAKERDFLQFQLEEFDKAELIAGEQEKLERELQRLTNAEDIKRQTLAAFQYLSESEQSVISQLEELGVQINQISKFDKNLDQLNDRFNGIIAELQDLSQEFETIAEETEYDEERIVEVQERLDLIYRLQAKHSVQTVNELLAIQEDISNRLTSINDDNERIEQLETEIADQEDKLRTKAAWLREKRQLVVPDFQKKVEKRLAKLAMEHAQLKIQFNELEELSPTGLDEIHFLFSANKGGRLQLIKDVASGGELSRLTLVTKSLVASAIPLPTLIFDEIDTGISGDVALKMGDILRKLSDQHQVVSITHSPQIASKADAHYFVYKQVKDDRTISNIRELEQEERIEAIAVMLSQSPPSKSALENARELLASR
ncbi:MAG: DNA repair protein RecN [Saprospiraceae bacterium]|nr:DNA repair protein RecN [Saprospiraceae bacterium]